MDKLPATYRFVVVGGGRMGGAIVGGLLDSGIAHRSEVCVVEPDEAARERLASRHRVDVVPDASALRFRDGAALILAVKPQVIDEVVMELAARFGDSPPLVVSIAAGVPTRRVESMLPAGTPVVRVMPNTPALVGSGVSAISGGASASVEHIEATRSLFQAFGIAVVVDESLQNAVTAVSGSGPAYVALFVDALISAGVSHGLSPDVARELVLATVGGTVDLLAGTGQTPSQIIEAVSSPGGTTVAAREALDKHGFAEAITDAVDAAVARAGELGDA